MTPPHPCRACGALVDEPLFRYCPDHAPAHRATAHRSYIAHRAERLAYQRARRAKPPVVNLPCPECSAPVPPYAGRNRVRTFCSKKCRDRNHEKTRPKRAAR